MGLGCENETLSVWLFIDELHSEAIVSIIIENVWWFLHDSLQLFAVDLNIVEDFSLAKLVKWILTKKSEIRLEHIPVFLKLLIVILENCIVGICNFV